MMMMMMIVVIYGLSFIEDRRDKLERFSFSSGEKKNAAPSGPLSRLGQVPVILFKVEVALLSALLTNKLSMD